MSFNGFRLISQALDAAAQAALAKAVVTAARAAPFYRPVTASGRPMSVEQTSFGPLGWITDQAGYRYEPLHPVTGEPWPPAPETLLALWARYVDDPRAPDSCLINRYRDRARMGLHQDADEADQTVPVISVSLGDTAIFRLGGAARGDPTTSVRLASGDVCILAGASRRAYHGVDRIIAGSSRLIEGGGRISLTLRRAVTAVVWRKRFDRLRLADAGCRRSRRRSAPWSPSPAPKASPRGMST
jgi:alkylated DNA repair protein (DNA oxidative demethylase)